MNAVHYAATTELPGSALPTWLTLAAGAIALIVFAAWSWLKKSPRTRTAVLASTLPIAAAAIVGGLYLATESAGLSDDGQPIPLSEDIDIQLPTLSIID